MFRLLQSTFIVVAGTAVAVYGYQRFLHAKPCAAPIAYSIGTLDSRFGVTQKELIQDLQKASTIWDSSIGRPLFIYDPKASLTVSLVYDTRQQTTQKEIQTKAVISQTKQTAASAKELYLASKAKYESTQKEYLVAVKDLSAKQDSYNTKVEYWNAHGGAPPKDYAALQDEKAILMKSQTVIDAQRLQVNQLAEDTNALIAKYNALVDDVNAKVEIINNDGLAGTQFEEGVYISDAQGKRIEIYQFDNQTTFIRVLAHEMGHALGLEHNNNPESIMSPINSGKNLSLTTVDMQELTKLCNI